MKIVHIIPGTGGAFYCENCVKDGSLVKALRQLGNQVTMIPMYLPLTDDEPDISGNTPIFFGAVNVYLQEKYPFLLHAPHWLNQLLDSPALLKFAASKAGSTRASGLEEMTLSMLRGEAGNQQTQLEQLVTWLKDEVQPDVVYLANAFLLGLARRIKQELHVPVVCALQDEDTWIQTMQENYVPLVWATLAERAQDVDAFVPVSQYYANIIANPLRIPPEKLQVVPIGINLEGYEPAPLTFDPPVIGFLSRMSESLGLGTLVEAFIKLKQDERLQSLKLHITGGHTADDQPFLDQIKTRLAAEQFLGDVKFFSDFDKNHRVEFLQSLTVMSVPMKCGEAFGIFQIEALAAGVPVVQPKIGAFPEIIEATGGGLIYEPNTVDALTEALASLLLNPPLTRTLGQKGLQAVTERFTNEYMAKQLLAVYENVVDKNL